MNIYLDIETIPDQRPEGKARALEGLKPPANYKSLEAKERWLTEHAAEAWERTALDGGYGEIVVIGLAIDDSEIVTFHQTEDMDERGVLCQFEGFWSSAAERAEPEADQSWPRPALLVVGHCADFDIRFLWQRCWVHGLGASLRQWRFPALTSKPWSGRIFDTSWSWSGKERGIRLKELAAILAPDIEADDIDGAEVWPLWSSGRRDEVVRHCVLDVERVRAIHQRMTA